MKRLALLLALAVPCAAQTTISITNTVQTANLVRPGINFAPLTNYMSGIKIRDFNLVNNGYLPVPYWNIQWPCSGGSTSSFQSNISGGGYPANFFSGYAYNVVTPTGSSKGTGTITSSTDTTSAGPTFGLSGTLSSACTTGGSTTQDVILLNPPSTQALNTLSFSEYFSTHTTGSCTFENSFVMNGNFAQDLDCPSTGSISFGLDATVGQQQNTVSTTAQPSIFFNGTYTALLGVYNAGSCSPTVSVGRVGSTAFYSNTFTPAAFAWTVYSPTFTASETASAPPTQTAQLNVSWTGHCKFQEFDVIESSTDVTNTTILRDDTFHALKKMGPGSIRFMPNGQGWGADSNHLKNTSYGLVGASGLNPYVRNSVSTTLSYLDELNICKAVGTVHCWISGGNFAPPSDYAAGTTYLAANAGGQIVDFEYGNEAWNSATTAAILGGDGVTYGYLANLVGTAIRGASGYNASTIKIVYDGWSQGSQSYGTSGWMQNVMVAGCPDYMDAAYYTLNELDSLTDVFTDEVAENVNVTTKTGYSTSGSFMSAKQTAVYVTSLCPSAKLAEYEYQYSPTGGTATPTQLQMNQISGSSGNGLVEYLHALLMEQQASVPLTNEFSLANDAPCNNSINGTCHVSWTALPLMPGAGGTDIYSGWGIYATVGNAARGSNNNLISSSQSGTPTINYAGGQGGSIDSNSALPQVYTFVYINSAKTLWTVLAFNTNETASQAVTFSYASAPVGTVTKTVVGGTTNALTDNNANSNISNNSTAAVMVLPTAGTCASGCTSDTLPAGSMTTYTYSTSSTPGTGVTITGQGTITGSTTITAPH